MVFSSRPKFSKIEYIIWLFGDDISRADLYIEYCNKLTNNEKVEINITRSLINPGLVVRKK